MDKIQQLGEHTPNKVNHFGHYLGWLRLPCEGVPMDKINTAGLLYVGAHIDAFSELDRAATYSSCFEHLYGARNALKSLMEHEILPLGVSQPSFARFKDAVYAALESAEKTPSESLSSSDYWGLVISGQRAMGALTAELENADTYFVAEVNGYNTRTLIERGEKILGETLAKSLPEKVKIDLCEATKALAFRLHTAVGFHMLRAVEAAIMEYLTILKIPRPTKPIERNLGNYIALLKKGGVDEKVLLPLDLLRKEHRNELMHPDRILGQDESLNLFEVCKGALMTLITDMNMRTASTTPAAVVT